MSEAIILARDFISCAFDRTERSRRTSSWSSAMCNLHFKHVLFNFLSLSRTGSCIIVRYENLLEALVRFAQNREHHTIELGAEPLLIETFLEQGSHAKCWVPEGTAAQRPEHKIPVSRGDCSGQEDADLHP